jgi:phosphate transport system substrate-binding protein
MRVIQIAFLILLVINSACTNHDKHGKILSTPTSGVLKIAADESLKPVIENEIKTFESLYNQAHINVQFISEEDAIAALLNDSVSLVITTRKLTEPEVKILERLKLFPKQLAVAKDGIALILNRNNPDSIFQIEQLKKIVSGEITNWQQLNSKSKPSTLEVVFDNPHSGMIRFLNDSVAPVDKIPKNFFALNSNKAVVEYVSQKPNALGLIGVSWISSKDSTANTFLKTIKVAGFGNDTASYKPYQAYLALGNYPLQRNIFAISREAHAGLANGFMAFLASDRGQRIILKSGIVPVTMPLRIVEINHEPLNLP